MAIMTKESVKRQITESPVIAKYARRISLLESARKASGAKPMSTFDKYYVGQLFENLSKGNLYEGYTQAPGNYRRDAYNIVSIAVQNTILDEIVSVQPINICSLI